MAGASGRGQCLDITTLRSNRPSEAKASIFVLYDGPMLLEDRSSEFILNQSAVGAGGLGIIRGKKSRRI